MTLVFKVGVQPDGSLTWWSSHVRKAPECVATRFATKREAAIMRDIVEGKHDPKAIEWLKSSIQEGFNE